LPGAISTFAAQHFTGFGIPGQPLLINGVAVVLEHQLTGISINLDQEVTAGIQRNEALGEAFIQSIDGRSQRYGGFRGLDHLFNLQTQ
jgi:hypothetical protein